MPYPADVRCDYYSAGVCRSCTWLPTAYAEQLSRKQHTCEQLIASNRWLSPVSSRESGFRNKAKLVVGGTPGDVTLGILDQDLRGIDLRNCGLYEPGLAQAIPRVADLINALRLLPYDVNKRRGELKYVHLTHSLAGKLIVRFVLRSMQQASRITYDAVVTAIPNALVVTLNLQPEHKAVLEGIEEVVLSPTDVLPIPLDHPVELSPQSFFQTNTAIAQELYRQAAAWTAVIEPTSVLDAYCGVGGFAFHVAAPGRHVVGVDVSPGQSRAGVELVAHDALELAKSTPQADLVVVNPPRRGIGKMASWLETSKVPNVIYSSCNPTSLAADLRVMASYDVTEARMFDMFPHTEHLEVMVLLSRKSNT